MNSSWVEFDSTTLARAAYHDQPALLRLQFRSGAYYVYSAVPPQVFQDLLDSPSKGTYFNRYIRNLYAFVKAAGEN